MSSVKKIVSLHGENEHGRIPYHCRIGKLNKQATFEEMGIV